MIRRILAGVCAVALTLSCLTVTSSNMVAQDKKEEKKAEVAKLEGKITCNKCDLGKSEGCETVIVVKDGDKEVTYIFDKAAHKKYHDDTCKAGKAGTVKGEVKKDGDKMIVTVKELEYKK
jgi:hypothetical protein